MKDWETLLISTSMKIIDAVELLDKSAKQILMVVDEDRKLLGAVTDGDIRRGIVRSVPFTDEVRQIMFMTPRTASPNESKESLLERMTALRVHQMPLVDTSGRVIGLTTMEGLVGGRTPRKNWVVLMAGGLGSRLMPLTQETPKPMLNVGGKPVLETIMENFVKHDFRRFYISVNYKADKIKAHFGDGGHWGVEIRYLHEESPLGTAGPLGLIQTKPEAPILVMNGDLITQVNFRDLMDYHGQQNTKATMCVREYDFQVPFGVVNIEDDKIMDIDEKPVHRFFVNAGIYVLDPGLIDLAEKGRRMDMTDLFETVIKKGVATSVFPIHEYWLDIGRADDLDRAKLDFDKVFSQ